jgi:hypothetical protein
MDIDNITKLDVLPKDDPQLAEKTSDLIQKRQQEELRRAQLKEELKMANAREDARVKKQNIIAPTPPPMSVIKQVEDKQELKKEENLTSLKDDVEYVKTEKMKEIITGINKSFAWLEQYIVQQNAQNAKVDKFIHGLQSLINDYNKK